MVNYENYKISTFLRYGLFSAEKSPEVLGSPAFETPTKSYIL